MPLGIRQCLSLAVTHKPDLLIFDESTFGIDPVAWDMLWESIISLACHDWVIIFISDLLYE